MKRATNRALKRSAPDPVEGSIHDMIRIDDSGRLVLPKQIRQRAKLLGGDRFQAVFRDEDGVIELVPLSRDVRIETRQGFPVAVPAEEGPLLRSEVVEESITRLRTRR